jgi:hypothetical protein
MQQRLAAEQLPTQPGTAAGMSAGVRLQQEPVFCGGVWAVVGKSLLWLFSLVLWILSWVLVGACYGLLFVLGLLFGSQRYANVPVAAYNVPYMA